MVSLEMFFTSGIFNTTLIVDLADGAQMTCIQILTELDFPSY
jgi:hypothetical protein